MDTKQTSAKAQDKESLATQINTLDVFISKIIKCFNSHSLTKVSLFITGKTDMRKDFHEMLHTGTNTGLPVPADLLTQFFQQYGDSLIAQRNTLVMELEALDNPVLALQDPQAPRILDNAEFFCPVCVRATDHRLHQSEMGVHWKCDCCSNINTNAEID